MTAHDFRGVVLGLSGVVEGAHMGHADFRVNGRIFSSLTSDESRATVKLTPEAQARLMDAAPGVFLTASGAWGRQGWTLIALAGADIELVGEAVTIAWQVMQAMPPVKPRQSTVGAAAAVARSAGNPTRPKTSTRPKTAPANSTSAKKAAAGEVKAVDAYIARCAPEVRSILTRIRGVIRETAPEATERISYQMPAFFQDGALLYYAPFKHHIGMYPPVTAGAALEKELSRYRGEKGNLRFPLDEPMPYGLIQRVVRARLAEHTARRAAKQRTGGKSKAKPSTTKPGTSAKGI